MEEPRPFQVSIRRPRTSGFSLLEVLVALVVTSLGLLGIAALQANGLRANHGAYLHSQASYLASDIADRMRSNLEATFAGDYQVTALPDAPTLNCIASACDPAAMAQADLRQWYVDVLTLLPSGQVAIACAGPGNPPACTRGSLHTITVRWDGNRNGATGTACRPAVAADLLCVQMSFLP